MHIKQEENNFLLAHTSLRMEVFIEWMTELMNESHCKLLSFYLVYSTIHTDLVHWSLTSLNPLAQSIPFFSILVQPGFYGPEFW